MACLLRAAVMVRDSYFSWRNTRSVFPKLSSIISSQLSQFGLGEQNPAAQSGGVEFEKRGDLTCVHSKIPSVKSKTQSVNLTLFFWCVVTGEIYYV